MWPGVLILSKDALYTELHDKHEKVCIYSTDTAPVQGSILFWSTECQTVSTFQGAIPYCAVFHDSRMFRHPFTVRTRFSLYFARLRQTNPTCYRFSFRVLVLTMSDLPQGLLFESSLPITGGLLLYPFQRTTIHLYDILQTFYIWIQIVGQPVNQACLGWPQD